jgi:DNA-directed RNA polymerase subunit alpha
MVFTDLKVKKISEEGFKGVYELAPMPRGYGNTLVTSLRRILLSSIPGGAATAITVKGVQHEYTAVEGIKEDIMELLLNVKAVAFACSSDEPQICKLSVSGKKEVTAKDISVTGDVEVMNPEIKLATLTAKDSKLEIEIVVEKGVGYQKADEDLRGLDGKLPLSADFSPVMLVNTKVVSARKGQQANLDGAIIEIETNGSIAPIDALLDAAKILQEFAGSVMIALGVSKNEVEQSAIDAATPVEVEEEEEGVNEEVMAWKIEDLPISKRSKSGLLAGGYDIIGDMVEVTSTDLLSLPGFGNKSLNEVIELLGGYGIDIK